MKQEKGFTLLEILIALLVLSIGLLGLAKLQTFGLHSNHSANLRTLATLLAYDIADRMRSNRSAYLDDTGGYIDPPSGSSDKQCEWNGSTVQDCSPLEMAQFDIGEWRKSLAVSLPDGFGTVCLDATPNDGEDNNADGAIDSTEFACDGTGKVYAIKVWWSEMDEKTGAQVFKRFVTTFQP